MACVSASIPELPLGEDSRLVADIVACPQNRRQGRIHFRFRMRTLAHRRLLRCVTLGATQL